MLDVSPEELAELTNILRAHVPGCTVWAYGSRVAGAAHPGSDLDLVVIDKERLSLRTWGELREAFDESNLTFTVDLFDWCGIPDYFKPAIERQHEVVKP